MRELSACYLRRLVVTNGGAAKPAEDFGAGE